MCEILDGGRTRDHRRFRIFVAAGPYRLYTRCPLRLARLATIEFVSQNVLFTAAFFAGITAASIWVVGETMAIEALITACHLAFPY